MPVGVRQMFTSKPNSKLILIHDIHAAVSINNSLQNNLILQHYFCERNNFTALGGMPFSMFIFC